MDSSGFYILIKNFTTLTEDECKEVGALSKQYPYSQLLHLLHARAAQDLQSPDRAAILNQSAVYSTDRSILKTVMTATRLEREAKVEVEKVPKPEEAVVPVKIEQPVPLPPTPAVEVSLSPAPLVTVSSTEGIALSGDALRSDLYHELEKLQQLKHDFEVSFDEFQKSTHKGVDVRRTVNSVKEPVNDPLVEAIKSTKKKLKVDSPKLKEQNEIIDKFIKIQPVIPKPKPSEPTSDLSEDSAVLSDNIVSETLVDILIKQGKSDKAIEVLKKLIWKFPQKKAYFAAQIENLKN